MAEYNDPQIESVVYEDIGDLPDIQGQPSLIGDSIDDVGLFQDNNNFPILEIPDLSNFTGATGANLTKTPDVFSKVAAASRSYAPNDPRSSSFQVDYIDERYDDPEISYDPNADMESQYAAMHPWNKQKALGKFWEKTKAHSFQFINSLGAAIKASSSGDFSKLYNNEFTDHLAEVTENIERNYPIFKTQDQSENPFALRNIGFTTSTLLPEAGTAVGSVVDMVVGTAIQSVLNPNKGAVLAGAAAKLNSLKSLGKVKDSMWRLTKSLNTPLAQSQTSSRINKAVQMIGASAFYANSEAALQAKMNADQYIEHEMRAFKNVSGGASLSDIKSIKEKAKSLQASTYKLNLSLITGSNILQFPGLLSGKVSANIANSLPVRLAGGEAVKKSTVGHITKEFLKDSFSEGFEEYGQGVIDEATQHYYSTQNGKFNTLTGEIFNASFNRLNQEGALEFFGGALIGGGMSLASSLPRARSTHRNAKTFVQNFNQQNRSFTEKILNNFQNENRLNHQYSNRLSESLANSERNYKRLTYALGDNPHNKVYDLKVKSILQDEVLNLSKVDVDNASVEMRLDYLNTLKELETSEFNKLTGLDLNTNEQIAYTNSLKEEYVKAVDIRTRANELFSVNPFIEQPWYKEAFNRISPVKTKQRKASVEIWNSLKDVAVMSAYKAEDIDKHMSALRPVIWDAANPVEFINKDDIEYLFNSNIEEGVQNWIDVNTERFQANLPGKKQVEGFINKLESLSTSEKFSSILDKYGVTDTSFTLFDEYLQMDASKKVFTDKVEKLNTLEGQREQVEQLASFTAAWEDKILKYQNTKREKLETPSGTVSSQEEPKKELTDEEQAVVTESDGIVSEMEKKNIVITYSRPIRVEGGFTIEGDEEELVFDTIEEAHERRKVLIKRDAEIIRASEEGEEDVEIITSGTGNVLSAAFEDGESTEESTGASLFPGMFEEGTVESTVGKIADDSQSEEDAAKVKAALSESKVKADDINNVVGDIIKAKSELKKKVLDRLSKEKGSKIKVSGEKYILKKKGKKKELQRVTKAIKNSSDKILTLLNLMNENEEKYFESDASNKNLNFVLRGTVLEILNELSGKTEGRNKEDIDKLTGDIQNGITSEQDIRDTIFRIKVASIFGSVIDKFARDYFDLGENDISVDPALYTYNDMKVFTGDQLQKIKTEYFAPIKKFFDDNGWYIDTREKTFYKESQLLAGSPDMVVIDSQGNHHIFDFKTMKTDADGSFLDFWPKNFYSDDKYDSKRSRFSKQLNSYDLLSEEDFGESATSVNIIAIPLTYGGENAAVLIDDLRKGEVSFRFLESEPQGTLGNQKVHVISSDLRITPDKTLRLSRHEKLQLLDTEGQTKTLSKNSYEKFAEEIIVEGEVVAPVETVDTSEEMRKLLGVTAESIQKVALMIESTIKKFTEEDVLEAILDRVSKGKKTKKKKKKESNEPDALDKEVFMKERYEDLLSEFRGVRERSFEGRDTYDRKLFDEKTVAHIRGLETEEKFIEFVKFAFTKLQPGYEKDYERLQKSINDLSAEQVEGYMDNREYIKTPPSTSKARQIEKYIQEAKDNPDPKNKKTPFVQGHLHPKNRRGRGYTNRSGGLTKPIKAIKVNDTSFEKGDYYFSENYVHYIHYSYVVDTNSKKNIVKTVVLTQSRDKFESRIGGRLEDMTGSRKKVLVQRAFLEDSDSRKIATKSNLEIFEYRYLNGITTNTKDVEKLSKDFKKGLFSRKESFKRKKKLPGKGSLVIMNGAPDPIVYKVVKKNYDGTYLLKSSVEGEERTVNTETLRDKYSIAPTGLLFGDSTPYMYNRSANDDQVKLIEFRSEYPKWNKKFKAPEGYAIRVTPPIGSRGNANNSEVYVKTIDIIPNTRNPQETSVETRGAFRVSKTENGNYITSEVYKLGFQNKKQFPNQKELRAENLKAVQKEWNENPNPDSNFIIERDKKRLQFEKKQFGKLSKGFMKGAYWSPNLVRDITTPKGLRNSFEVVSLESIQGLQNNEVFGKTGHIVSENSSTVENKKVLGFTEKEIANAFNRKEQIGELVKTPTEEEILKRGYGKWFTVEC